MPWTVTISSPRVADADLAAYRWFVGGVFQNETVVTPTMDPVQGVVTIAADGSYALTVASRDQAGNVSAQSAALNLTLDHIAPVIPNAPTIVVASWA